jgi:hypothetical protein
MTIEYGPGLPKVLYPTDFALTFNGETYRLYYLRGAPQLICQGTLSAWDEKSLLHPSKITSWYLHDMAA